MAKTLHSKAFLICWAGTGSKAKIKKVINDLSDEGYRDNVKILIGGNIPVIHSAADVGADYYCENMLKTVELLRELACSSNKFQSGAFAVNSV